MLLILELVFPVKQILDSIAGRQLPERRPVIKLDLKNASSNTLVIVEVALEYLEKNCFPVHVLVFICM